MRFDYRGLFIAIALLWWLLIPALRATDGVRELPSAPETQSALGSDYSLHTASFAGSSVTLIDVHSGEGDWLRSDPAKLPAFPASTPPSLKGQLQWFYGGVAGWMPVPTGWRVQQASVGADGGTVYTFVAPEGAASGWVSYTVVPACVGCLLQEAEGLLPGAEEHLAELSDAPVANPGQTNPALSWQSHPDDCTALFRYRSGNLQVHAAVLSSEPIAVLDNQKGDLSLADIYAALPASKAMLAEFMVTSFRQTFLACHAPGGWAG
jgi:hypothetical protein